MDDVTRPRTNLQISKVRESATHMPILSNQPIGAEERGAKDIWLGYVHWAHECEMSRSIVEKEKLR